MTKLGQYLLTIGLLVFVPQASSSGETRLLRYPDIHGNKIVFCYGGDLYLSSIAGQNVRRLTSWPGEEILPKFSSDGRRIAFTAELEGNMDVYVMSVSGGQPRRLTFHPADERVVDWSPDGKSVVFRSNALSFSDRVNRLLCVPAEDGLVQALELPEADQASFNETGDKVAFCRTPSDGLPRGYRGGAAPGIWMYDLARGTSEPLVADGCVNGHPLWIGDSIYYVSDKGDRARPNLWVYDLKAKASRPLTRFNEWPVRWPSRGGSRIVFENQGRIVVFDVRTESLKPVLIEVPGAGEPRVEEAVGVEGYVSGAPALSPDGRKVVLSARGDLFLIDPDSKSTVNVTRTPGACERYPQWNPGGGSFVYVSDATGEDQIYVLREGAGGEPEQVSRMEAGRIGPLSWSPDGRRIGFPDHRAAYHILDLETGATKRVFFNAYQGSVPFASAAWSPDGRWLAYTLGEPNWLSSVWLYSLDQDRSFRVTNGSYHASDPRFDLAGRCLYWVAYGKTNVEDSFWDGDHHIVNPSTIVAATLRREDPSPFAPGPASSAPVTGGTGPAPMRIDVEGLGERIMALPVEDSTYDALRAVEGGLVYRSSPAAGGSSFKLFDLASKKETVLSRDAFYLVPAAHSAKAVYRGDEGIGILDLHAEKDAGDAKLDISGLRMDLDRRREWAQIFAESWRTVRDFFYDDGLRGLDWPAVRRKYETLLPHVASRQDLSHLVEEMFAELGHSHLEISGGDLPVVPRRGHGLLGVDLEPDPATHIYRIVRIFRGRNWEPDMTGPLALPGMDVKPGDYLLAIDGAPLREGINPDSLLLDKAGRDVVVTVNSFPSIEGARRLTVRPVAWSENGGDPLRYADWVSRNRESVEKASGGRIGYLHLPDTYIPGIAAFFRQAPALLHKEGLILDVRYNGGGYSPVWMIERLNRRMIFRSSLPYGKASISEPDPVFVGLKACLINDGVESSGETFAAIFRQWDVGPIIGRRTAGRLASTGGMRLVDGGVLVYPAEGKGVIENVGVSPDIDIENWPEDVMRRVDKQLERAVAELMKRLPGTTLAKSEFRRK
jgi:tricorn protease